MPMMQAIQLHEWGAPPVLRSVEIPTPSDDQVLLEVEAAGVCHSDLHLLDGTPGQFPFTAPFTLGHEIVGTVRQVGRNVAEHWIGQSAAVYALVTCGVCTACTGGRENYCKAISGNMAPGIGYDGGLANYVLIRSVRQLVPIGNVAAHEVAPLTDAGITSYHAIRQHRDVLTRGSRVLVVGIGGLGHLAVQILRATTAVEIVAVDTRHEARQEALQFGASAAYKTIDQAVDATADDGFEVIFDFVGTSTTATDALYRLATGGRLVLVGSAGAKLVVGKHVNLPRGWTVTAPFWGTKHDLQKVIKLTAEGKISAHTQTYSLAEGLDAYQALRRNEVTGRAVIIP